MKAALFAFIPIGILFAQTPTPTFLQAVTTGIVSFSTSQTAQLNVLNINPVVGTTGATATVCTVQLEFHDSQGALLKQLLVDNIAPGASASLTLTRAEAASLSTPRFALRGVVRTAPVTAGSTSSIPATIVIGCPIFTTLEVFDATTGNTQLVTSDTRPMTAVALPLVAPGLR
jgi:hypothetical protein